MVIVMIMVRRRMWMRLGHGLGLRRLRIRKAVVNTFHASLLELANAHEPLSSQRIRPTPPIEVTNPDGAAASGGVAKVHTLKVTTRQTPGQERKYDIKYSVKREGYDDGKDYICKPVEHWANAQEAVAVSYKIHPKMPSRHRTNVASSSADVLLCAGRIDDAHEPQKLASRSMTTALRASDCDAFAACTATESLTSDHVPTTAPSAASQE
ncbi:hypothetical protein EJ03DRAFT_359139 [Teratosphaeria nubilosa]|uniref:Uncharacterized protein n=1 Tax=Teratosphaeria nubilosa TaxID=161662 RepID=A0A6G1KTX2_9PEZI|nr:hypothetical protein EJ03DRAFT_359139 [Teratosphaeria nubilosa]